MSVLRSIGLSQGGVAAEDSQHESAAQERRPADEALVRSFEEQMQEARMPAQPPPQSRLSDGAYLTPLSLFGAASRSTHARILDVTQNLSAMLTGLRVDQGGQGSAAPMLEMDVDDILLPGATIRLSESEGRLQVDFTCRDDAVRLQLNAQAPTMAATLRARLQRPVLVRVQSHVADDPQVMEALET